MSIHVVWPSGSMALLTQIEAESISNGYKGDLYPLYRNCSLAVLNSGSITDNSKELLENFESFDINVVRTERGLKIELINPPESAVVNGRIIKSLRKHLYAVLRDIVQLKMYNPDVIKDCIKNQSPADDLMTNFIFMILRKADVLTANTLPNIAVCWGGHSIPKDEYDYCYDVGFQLGLRKIDICTGCGPGVMEAPMKGAIMGHVLQGATDRCRLIGLTEPSIIAAEPPNAMVSDLVIMPDIEKRLEAFVRLGHSLIIFPGGPGTAEELLFILSLKLHPANRRNLLPLILTGNKASSPYFDTLERFLITCFGHEITRCYKRIDDDPKAVADEVNRSLETVTDHRTLLHDSYSYNWLLKVPDMLQQPFKVNHETMAALDLHRNQEPWMLAANLRAAFSGIVSGNVKEEGTAEVAKNGPFRLHGDPEIIEGMEKLMQDFIDQGRILLSGRKYTPCYVFEPDSQE